MSTPPLEENKLREIATKAESVDAPHSQKKPFGHHWGVAYWPKWTTIIGAVYELGIGPGAKVLDIGVGSGWTSVFLAESGFDVLGFDIAPASVELGTRRANRYGVKARFATADMDAFDFDEQFDFALLFDALHHSTRQADVVANVARHLQPKGWVLFGEPSVLHAISPGARRTTREVGWVERGVSVHRLKRDCATAGLGEFRRFYEGSRPVPSSATAFAWQLTRLLAARVGVAPQTSVWLAARKPASAS